MPWPSGPRCWMASIMYRRAAADPETCLSFTKPLIPHMQNPNGRVSLAGSLTPAICHGLYGNETGDAVWSQGVVRARVLSYCAMVDWTQRERSPFRLIAVQC